MRYFKLALSTTALLCVQSFAQQGKDFSGVWRMDASRSESAHQGPPIGRVTLVIKQAPQELSIETQRTKADGSKADSSTVASETLLFKLDGSENSVVVDQGTRVKVKARWDGANLVTETERSIRGATVTTMHVLSLDASGKELTVDKTLTVQHGYESSAGNNVGKAKDVFVKSQGVPK